MKERNLRGVIAVALGVCLSVGLFATNAIAKPAPSRRSASSWTTTTCHRDPR